MFQQIFGLLPSGTTIHLMITKAGEELQVISSVKSVGEKMHCPPCVLKGAPEDMQNALLSVLLSKSEVVTTLQEQVSAAQMQDKKTIANALSKPAGKTSTTVVLQAPDDDDEEEGEFGPDTSTVSQAPKAVAVSPIEKTSQPVIQLF